jgi:hypothetical protein
MSWVLANQNVSSGMFEGTAAPGDIMGTGDPTQALQAAQAAQTVGGAISNVESGGTSSELESRVAQLETSRAGSAGGGEVAGVAGFNQGDINTAQSIRGDNRRGYFGRILNPSVSSNRRGGVGGINSLAGNIVGNLADRKSKYKAGGDTSRGRAW